MLGLGLVVYFVQRAGPSKVLAALRAAGPYAPLLAGLEAVAIACDVKAFASLLGPEAALVSLRNWLRSTGAAYGCFALVPAGRAASEVARASFIAPDVGVVRAATAGAQLQAAALAADGVASAACVLALGAFGVQGHHLPALLSGNAVLTLGSGVGLLYLIRHRRFAARVSARFPRFFAGLTASELMPRTLGVAACCWGLLGRAAQALGYGVAVLAMSGRFSVRAMAVAYGVHAVAATVGVGIPIQLGVADGAYLLFADTLGFQSDPARALAVMFSIRVTQVALAVVGLLVPVVVRRGRGDP